MNRRSFLSGLSALIGGIALEQAIPFNRVWSFPKKLHIAEYPRAIMSPTRYVVYGGSRQGGKRLAVEMYCDEKVRLAAREFNRQLLFYRTGQYLRFEANNIPPNFGEWVSR